MRFFLCVLVAVVCIAAITPTATACNGVQAVVIQRSPIIIAAPPAIILDDGRLAFGLATPAAFLEIRNGNFRQRDVILRASAGGTTVIRSFTGPLGLLNVTTIRQR